MRGLPGRSARASARSQIRLENPVPVMPLVQHAGSTCGEEGRIHHAEEAFDDASQKRIAGCFVGPDPCEVAVVYPGGTARLPDCFRRHIGM
jgi:hypothetical protein